jgi:hypothetical protein
MDHPPSPRSNSAVPARQVVLLGWKEYVDFPDWQLRRVKAKIDTGARTSALDARDYEVREGPDQRFTVRLRLILHRRHPDRLTLIEAPILGFVNVSSSNGVREQRPVLETTIRLGSVLKRVRLTVTDRSNMLFPMILGRTALGQDFLVDVSQKYLLKRSSQ